MEKCHGRWLYGIRSPCSLFPSLRDPLFHHRSLGNLVLARWIKYERHFTALYSSLAWIKYSRPLALFAFYFIFVKVGKKKAANVSKILAVSRKRFPLSPFSFASEFEIGKLVLSVFRSQLLCIPSRVILRSLLWHGRKMPLIHCTFEWVRVLMPLKNDVFLSRTAICWLPRLSDPVPLCFEIIFYGLWDYYKHRPIRCLCYKQQK